MRMLTEWKGCEVIELNVQPDHVYLVVCVPPKLAISTLMGVLKGKLAIKLFESCPQLKKKPYWGSHFWARGYFMNTVGINEDHIRRYVHFHAASRLVRSEVPRCWFNGGDFFCLSIFFVVARQMRPAQPDTATQTNRPEDHTAFGPVE